MNEFIVSIIQLLLALVKDSPEALDKILSTINESKEYEYVKPPKILSIRSQDKRTIDEFPWMSFQKFKRNRGKLPSPEGLFELDAVNNASFSLLQSLREELVRAGWGYNFTMRRKEYISVKKRIIYSKNMTVLVWLRASEPDDNSIAYKNHRTIISQYNKPKKEFKVIDEHHFEFYIEGLPIDIDENGNKIIIQGDKSRVPKSTDNLIKGDYPEHYLGEFKAYIPPVNHLRPNIHAHSGDFGSGAKIDDNKNHFLAFTITQNDKDINEGTIQFYDNCIYLDERKNIIDKMERGHIWSHLNLSDFKLRKCRKHSIRYPETNPDGKEDRIFIGKQSDEKESDLMYFDGIIYRIEVHYESLSEDEIKKKHVNFLRDFTKIPDHYLDSLFVEDNPFTCHTTTKEPPNLHL
ncbi:hypothetical protein PseudUWO311_01395 [Pseudanabaena sp. UWO311]|uniref:hypothetical protein n=1 Tax=Pseudanabaena sp. UWO311 TaxID=2487337 RepID=UPI00115AD0B9|nr:hypothetical protein [Pseudanabaena sp. UWO311]TYQ29581.1 hypothetical protein PseudUWO311_01395 [Pseudanabaena sp. UWO311]